MNEQEFREAVEAQIRFDVKEMLEEKAHQLSNDESKNHAGKSHET